MKRNELVKLAKVLGLKGAKMKNEELVANINAILDNSFHLAGVEEAGYVGLEIEAKYNALLELQENLKKIQEEKAETEPEKEKEDSIEPEKVNSTEEEEFKARCERWKSDPMSGCIMFGKYDAVCPACKELTIVDKRSNDGCPSERHTDCLKATSMRQQVKEVKKKEKKKKSVKSTAGVNFINHRIGCQVALLDEMLLTGMTKDEGTDAIYDGTITGDTRIKDERYKKLFARVGNQIRHLKVDHGITVNVEKIPNRGTVYSINREDAEAHKEHLPK